MQAEALLREITDYCRRKGVAESTFGRHAVNDGKFVNRLREGGRITTTTFERVRSFIAADAAAGEGSSRPFLLGSQPGRRPAGTPASVARQSAPATAPGDRNFPFFHKPPK